MEAAADQQPMQTSVPTTSESGKAPVRLLAADPDHAGIPRSFSGIVRVPGPWPLVRGGVLPAVDIAYSLEGPLGAPVVAVLGGISATRQVAQTATAAGWWGKLIGPDQALDTKRKRVLSCDFLGGNGLTTGARSAGFAGAPFPDVTPVDQARMLGALIDALGLGPLQAFVGASYGGMVGLALAQTLPHYTEQLIVISAAHTQAPMAVAWRTLQRQILQLGLAAGQGDTGLALARSLAMTTYRTPGEFSQRFGGSATCSGSPDPLAVDADPDRSGVWGYLQARGADYVATMAPYAFLCLSRSIDWHCVVPEQISVPTTLVGVHEDQLVPLGLMQQLAARLPRLRRLETLASVYGHDAFLLENAFFSRILQQL